MKYSYFISYVASEFKIGSAEISRNKKITNLQDIIDLQDLIEKEKNLRKVTILNFKLFEKED